MKEIYEANIHARRIQNRKNYNKSNEVEKKKNYLPTKIENEAFRAFKKLFT